MDLVDVAVVGIVATLFGTLLAPVVAARLQRASLKMDRVLDRRLDSYVDLLELASQVLENAQTWSAIPLADLDEAPVERIRAIDARIRVLGSDEVRDAMLEVSRLSSRFFPALFRARLKDRRAHQEGKVDAVETIAARMGLGEIADQLRSALLELEKRVRAEMRV